MSGRNLDSIGMLPTVSQVGNIDTNSSLAPILALILRCTGNVYFVQSCYILRHLGLNPHFLLESLFNNEDMSTTD